MPKMIVATDKFPYGKTAYRRGAEVDIEDRYVELFLKSGKLRWPEGASPNASDLPDEVMSRARAPATEDDIRMFGNSFERIDPDGSKKRIDPHDVIVEDEPVVEKAMKAEAVEEDEAPKSATYHRRDLVAETPKTPLVPNKAIPYPKHGHRGRPRKSQS